MPKLLLVDGSNLLFQMFYGMPARIVNGDGKAIQGTLGFTGALLKIVRMTSPTHMAVIFDGEHKNARREIDEDYKANRPDLGEVPEEETPFSQLEDVKRALDHLGIRWFETVENETDDVIAAYAFSREGDEKIVIASYDSDFFQLIGEKVTVLRYRGVKTAFLTPGTLREKLGVEPWQYAGFKALTGDGADSIRGAEGIGPKTAMRLLGTHKTLEILLEKAGELPEGAVKASLLRNKERLRKNLRLIRLDGSAPLPFSREELCFSDPGVTTNEALRGIGL